MHPAALERGVLAFVGVCFTTFGVMSISLYTDQPVIDFAPGIWPVIFTAAGVSTLWWAERPLSQLAFKLSGVLCITALVARAVNIAYIISLHDAFTDPVQSRLALGIVAYLMSAVLLAYTWHRLWPRTVRLNSERRSTA